MLSLFLVCVLREFLIMSFKFLQILFIHGQVVSDMYVEIVYDTSMFVEMV